MKMEVEMLFSLKKKKKDHIPLGEMKYFSFQNLNFFIAF